MINQYWDLIVKECGIDKHDFKKEPFYINVDVIRKIINKIGTPGQRKSSILYKQTCCENRPDFFVKNNLFFLPIKKGKYVIIKGEGYFNIPRVDSVSINYKSKLTFELDTAKINNSATQHIDFAFAISILKTFLNDESLVLTIRGRKYTPAFSFHIGRYKIHVKGVQTEVDAGYEGEKQVVLVGAKNRKVENVIIRQLFYPFRQWSCHTKKKVIPVFFDRDMNEYRFWQFGFKDPDDYNSIFLVKSNKYII